MYMVDEQSQAWVVCTGRDEDMSARFLIFLIFLFFLFFIFALDTWTASVGCLMEANGSDFHLRSILDLLCLGLI